MGRKWETQALKMPYITNPGIDVFPAMPKRHSDLLKFYSNTMAPADKIW